MLTLDRDSLDLWQQSKIHPCNILGNNYPPDRLISFVVCVLAAISGLYN